MTKQERKELLAEMIEANDKMSPEQPHQAFIYAKCLVALCSNFEYKNAEAIWYYESENERLEGINEQWSQYVMDLEQPDSHSEMLYNLMTHQETVVNSLFEDSENAYNYFLGVTKDNGIIGPMEV